MNAYRKNYDSAFGKKGTMPNTGLESVVRPVVLFVAPTAQEYRDRARKALLAAERARLYLEETELHVQTRARIMMDRDYLLFLSEANLNRANTLEG